MNLPEHRDCIRSFAPQVGTRERTLSSRALKCTPQGSLSDPPPLGLSLCAWFWLHGHPFSRDFKTCCGCYCIIFWYCCIWALLLFLLILLKVSTEIGLVTFLKEIQCTLFNQCKDRSHTWGLFGGHLESWRAVLNGVLVWSAQICPTGSRLLKASVQKIIRLIRNAVQHCRRQLVQEKEAIVS